MSKDRSGAPAPWNESPAVDARVEELLAQLLKNTDDLLPLRADQLKSVAVIGADAASFRTAGGGGAHVTAGQGTGLLDALRRRLGDAVRVTHAAGVAPVGPAAQMPNDDFPLVLTTGRMLEHWHGGSMTRHSLLNELYPEARLEINPADAARLGVADQSAVRVSSRRGSVVARAWVSERATLGVVFLPFHFFEAAANLLTLGDLDPLAKIPEYKACAVRVLPVDENELERPDIVTERGRY